MIMKYIFGKQNKINVHYFFLKEKHIVNIFEHDLLKSDFGKNAKQFPMLAFYTKLCGYWFMLCLKQANYFYFQFLG